MTTPASTTLFGGRSLLVRFKDKDTAPRYMTVRHLPLRLLPEMGAALEDNARLLSLYLDLELSDTDAIHPESVEEALAIGDEMNLDPFLRDKAVRDARLIRFALAQSVSATGAPKADATRGPIGPKSSPESSPTPA